MSFESFVVWYYGIYFWFDFGIFFVPLLVVFLIVIILIVLSFE